VAPLQYVGQIGDPATDHTFWGRPSQFPVANISRPAYIFDATTKQADLLGGAAAALASASLVYGAEDPAFAARLLASARALWEWGTSSEGTYSSVYPAATAIYRSTEWLDDMVWGAAWLFRATGDASYAAAALGYWDRGAGARDVYPAWDSVWAPAAVVLVGMADDGAAVPGADGYRGWFAGTFLRAWLPHDGSWGIVMTPMGLTYPAWSEWGNLALAANAAMVVAVHARRNTRDPALRDAELAFVRRQVDYILGSTGRSFVVGWGASPPLFCHHAGASCPDMPAVCDWAAFSSPAPNPQVITGALVAGPGGVRLNATDPDASYYDHRNDYVTNEVALSYNAGLVGALAGAWELSG
jgi:hypothetical protein